MRFDTTCPRCRTTFSTDTAYLGAPRACGGCGATFVLECPRDVAAALKAERRPPRPLDRRPPAELAELACGACASGFRQPLRGPSHEVVCPYCGARQHEVIARRLVTTLVAAEARLWRALLCGVTPEAAIGEVTADGVTVAAAEALVRSRLPLLPFVRFASGGAAPTVTPTPPLACECCRSPLLARWRLVLVELSWRRLAIKPVTLMPGAEGLEAQLSRCVDPATGATRAAYFLCIGCGAAPKQALARHPEAQPLPGATVIGAHVLASRLQSGLHPRLPVPVEEAPGVAAR
ncbi:MAG: hypothetical protein INH41_00860 [Myxococcaceae bacterium]|nr:hypothetical protein [Myxococcaceae bacterium]MCA3010928.1 hypothetical protein [Myxococcaceae bacterium]